MSYLLVYLKKVPIFAARIRENNNIKQDTVMKRTFRAKGRKKLTVSDEYNGVKA